MDQGTLKRGRKRRRRRNRHREGRKLEEKEKKKEEKHPALFWQSVYIYMYLYGSSGHKPRKLLAIKTINMTKVASRQE